MEDKKGPEYLGRFLGAIVALLIYLTVTGCSSYRLATISDDMYPVDFTIPVSNETKIDTINSLFDLKYKLRTDFNFRWDFAQYAMQQRPWSYSLLLVSKATDSDLTSVFVRRALAVHQFRAHRPAWPTSC